MPNLAPPGHIDSTIEGPIWRLPVYLCYCWLLWKTKRAGKGLLENQARWQGICGKPNAPARDLCKTKRAGKGHVEDQPRWQGTAIHPYIQKLILII